VRGAGPAADAARVLVVDEAAMRTAIVRALAGSGWHCCARADGEDLEQTLQGYRPDLVVLDVMLPGRDGFRLLQVVRDHSDAGIVMVTARDGLDDRLHGLDSGADDYVVKPFLLAELMARVRAVLRRRGRLPSAVTVGDLIIDEAAGTASRGGAPLELTATELRLLGYLVEHRGRMLTKNQLLTQVWGYQDYGPNLVEVHLSALRRKLETHGPRIVHTSRNLGYTLRVTDPAPGPSAPTTATAPPPTATTAVSSTPPDRSDPTSAAAHRGDELPAPDSAPRDAAGARDRRGDGDGSNGGNRDQRPALRAPAPSCPADPDPEPGARR